MSDATLRDVVLKRPETDIRPEDEWAALVLAALEGANELAQLLDDGGRTRAQPHDETWQQRAGASKASKSPTAPRTAFLRRIIAQGFRGIGPKANLDLTPGPGPGLTLVVGRNGSGKSSFGRGRGQARPRTHRTGPGEWRR